MLFVIFCIFSDLIEKVTNFHDLHLTEPAKNVNVKLYGGLYYHGKDPLHPEVSYSLFSIISLTAVMGSKCCQLKYILMCEL